MFAHFDVEFEIDISTLAFKLNSFLPNDISIHDIFKVKDDAHARFDAISRTYHYKISTTKNVFTINFAYRLQVPLDIKKMNDACNILLQYKDFQCFSKSNTDVKTYYCTIEKAEWIEEQNDLIFIISADRFLRNMVRAIVGTMINIGLGKIQVKDLISIIESKNRSEAGFSVPAHGLYLTQITYPESLKL
jgi:tRNA pseudouridine38-40 synthase